MQTEFELNKTEASEQIRLLDQQLKGSLRKFLFLFIFVYYEIIFLETEFELQIMSLKNAKTFKTNNIKKDILNLNSKIRPIKKTQTSLNDLNKNKKEAISPMLNLKTETSIKMKTNQKENIKISTLLISKGKSHQSFHKTNYKKTNQNDDKPPFKFGLTYSNSKAPPSQNQKKEEFRNNNKI